ncbi:unnamed protein product, partial [Hymenolepis diminuta]
MIGTVMDSDPNSNLVSEIIDENTIKLHFEFNKKEQLSFTLLIPKDYPLSPIEWRSEDDMKAVEKYVNDLGEMKLTFTDQAMLIINVYYKLVRKRIPKKIAAFCGAHLADLVCRVLSDFYIFFIT